MNETRMNSVLACFLFPCSWSLLAVNRAYPIQQYPAKCLSAAAMMHMIMNNLNPMVAQVGVYDL